MAPEVAGSARGGRVVVVGSVNVDYVITVAHRPRPGETVSDAVVEFHGGGKGANQALAAALSGARTELVARVGEGAMGAARRQELAERGVGVSHVLVTPGVATGQAFITVTPGGENDMIVAPGANAVLAPADVASCAGLLGGGGVLLAQLEVPLATVEEVAPAGTLFVLNCAPWRVVPDDLLDRVDVLVANEHEASACPAGR